eukprot:2223141-Amphidinium_carterae.1
MAAADHSHVTSTTDSVVSVPLVGARCVPQHYYSHRKRAERDMEVFPFAVGKGSCDFCKLVLPRFVVLIFRSLQGEQRKIIDIGLFSFLKDIKTERKVHGTAVPNPES